MILTVLYDNYPFDPHLETRWGFAALVEHQEQTILFDTGGDWPTLKRNMDAMGVDPSRIELVVISHVHGDHTGGLQGLLTMKPSLPVYVPPSIQSAMQSQFPEADILGTESGQQVADGIFTTGELRQPLAEQALVIQTEQGLIVVTGCAHPGVDRLVERADELLGGPILLVMGGFHLGDASQMKIQRVISNLEAMEVLHVAPCHCTGDPAISAFRDAFGEAFIEAGVGKVLTLSDGEDLIP